jgi:hypothetical protein
MGESCISDMAPHPIQSTSVLGSERVEVLWSQGLRSHPLAEPFFAQQMAGKGSTKVVGANALRAQTRQGQTATTPEGLKEPMPELPRVGWQVRRRSRNEAIITPKTE